MEANEPTGSIRPIDPIRDWLNDPIRAPKGLMGPLEANEPLAIRALVGPLEANKPIGSISLLIPSEPLEANETIATRG